MREKEVYEKINVEKQGRWLPARRSQARQVAGCQLAGRWVLARRLPGRWLPARRSRARQVAGCRLTGRKLAGRWLVDP
ncbi:UNVERIFIED_CONTAM: hypothetical protein Sradi_5733000 [Sesamum radiatum]|uniref:Uncharacterized protein n=1 Tax=Sesamum radiatum TaxID=300843 RepID=A0AAW2L262_SESRA